MSLAFVGGECGVCFELFWRNRNVDEMLRFLFTVGCVAVVDQDVVMITTACWFTDVGILYCFCFISCVDEVAAIYTWPWE